MTENEYERLKDIDAPFGAYKNYAEWYYNEVIANGGDWYEEEEFDDEESDYPEKYKEYLRKRANHDEEYFNNQDEQEFFMCDECLQKFPMSCADDMYAGTCTNCAAKLED